jgi:hypothetical protein
VRGGGERRAQCQEVEARVPFIGREGERGGWEVAGQVAAGGASSKRWLQR